MNVSEDNINKSILFIGLKRGGSSICSSIIAELARSSGYEIRDIETEFYDNGIPLSHVGQDVFASLEPAGFYYGPFRSAPEELRNTSLRGFSKIIVVRDPRDCLVSNYYAVKNFHSKFEFGRKIEEMAHGHVISEDIDNYCLSMAFSYKEILQGLASFMYRNADSIVYRYEDIYYNPVGWISDVISRAKLRPTEDALKAATLQASFDTPQEDEFSHKRQGKPLDHTTKLRSSTIESISRVLEPELGQFGYGVRTVNFVSTDSDSPDTVQRAESASIKAIYWEVARENGYRIAEIADLRQQLAALNERIGATPAEDHLNVLTCPSDGSNG